MNIFDFKVFKYVAQFKSISVAAKELHMTQPAITHIINKLEKRYSLTLFDRSRQGTLLTENGQEFLIYVNQLLNEYENLENTAFKLQNKSFNKIVLATNPSFTVYCLAECIELENLNQSKYVLTVREGSCQEIFDWMSTGNADFSITLKEKLIPGFHYQVIGEDPYVMVSTKSVPSNLTTEDMEKYPFIMLLSNGKEVIESYLRQNKIAMNKVMESETISSTLALTLQINGITIVPLSGLNKKIINDFVIQPLEIKIQRPLIMQWSPKKESDPLFMSFKDNLLAQLKKNTNSLR
ncbi:LysR family transcriptional regulator (plasmid) [Bacillus mycoides]